MPGQDSTRCDYITSILDINSSTLQFSAPSSPLVCFLFVCFLAHGIHVFSATVLIQEALAAFQGGEAELVQKKHCEVSVSCCVIQKVS